MTEWAAKTGSVKPSKNIVIMAKTTKYGSMSVSITRCNQIRNNKSEELITEWDGEGRSISCANMNEYILELILKSATKMVFIWASQCFFLKQIKRWFMC